MASWQVVGWSRGLILVIKSVKAGNKYFSNRREENDKFYGNESPSACWSLLGWGAG